MEIVWGKTCGLLHVPFIWSSLLMNIAFKPSTGRPCWHRGSVWSALCLCCLCFVCVLSAFLPADSRETCVCLHLRKTACVRKNACCSKSLMFYSCVQSPVTADVNRLAFKHAEFIGNAASCSKPHTVIHNNSTCIFQLLLVARKCRNARAT